MHSDPRRMNSQCYLKQEEEKLRLPETLSAPIFPKSSCKHFFLHSCHEKMSLIQNHLMNTRENTSPKFSLCKTSQRSASSRNSVQTKEGTYLPSKTSGARSPNLCMNSKKGRRVGNPAQLILIASKTPLKENPVGYNQ